MRPVTPAGRTALSAAASFAALARTLEETARGLDDRVRRLAAARLGWEVERLLVQAERGAAPAAAEGIALWRDVIADPDPAGRLEHLMERPCRIGMMAAAAAAVLAAGAHPRTQPGRTLCAAMAAFVALDRALGRVAERYPAARRAPPAPEPALAPAAVTAREAVAFRYAVEVLAPALSRPDAGLMPFEAGFDEEAARRAAQRNLGGGAVAVPLVLHIGAARVPAVAEGEPGAVASLLEAAVLMGAGPALAPALLALARVPSGALPPALFARLSAGGEPDG